MKLFVWNLNSGEYTLVILHNNVDDARKLVKNRVTLEGLNDRYFSFLDMEPVIYDSPVVLHCDPTDYGIGAMLVEGL
jgi:hypothetical protein